VKSIARPLPETLFLMSIGLVDMISTILLVNLGLCQELNPLMAPLLNLHWTVFAAVKSLTLLAGFLACEWYRHRDEAFVRRWAKIGAFAYLGVWAIWFVGGWKI